MASDPQLAARKAALRRRLKAQREAIPAAVRQARARVIRARLAAMEPMKAAERVFAFLSTGTEVDTHPLVRRLLRQGRFVCVPKIVGPRMVACRLRDWAQLEPAQLGILTPKETEVCPGPFDVAITPGLGFSPHGARLGFGAGYYDRWFASHAVGARIALAFEAQILDDIPTSPADEPVDFVVTERRVIVTGARSGRLFPADGRGA